MRPKWVMASSFSNEQADKLFLEYRAAVEELQRIVAELANVALSHEIELSTPFGGKPWQLTRDVGSYDGSCLKI